jgi:hypothetical protein
MSKEISLLTPLPKAQTKNLRTSVQLPFRLENQLGINIPLTQELCQLGGVSHLKIISVDGEISSRAMNIVGMGSDGVALTGFGRVQTAEKSTHENIPGNMDAISQAQKWSNLTIKNNTNEQKQRFLEEEKDLRDPGIWAEELSVAIKKGIILAGFENLLTKNTFYD